MSATETPAAPAATEPAKTTTTPPATPAATTVDYSTDEGILKLDPEVQKYIKELRGETMSRKETIKAEKAARADAERERDELKAATKKATDDAERKRLEEEGNWKELAEKNKKQLDDTVKEYQTRAMRAEIKVAAQAAGIIDPDLVDLIPKDKITFNDKGEIQGISEAVEAFKAAKPNLFGTPGAAATTPPAPVVNPTGSGAGDPNPGVPGVPGKSVMEMTPAEYEKAKRDKLRAS